MNGNWRCPRRRHFENKDIVKDIEEKYIKKEEDNTKEDILKTLERLEKVVKNMSEKLEDFLSRDGVKDTTEDKAEFM